MMGKSNCGSAISTSVTLVATLSMSMLTTCSSAVVAAAASWLVGRLVRETESWRVLLRILDERGEPVHAGVERCEAMDELDDEAELEEREEREGDDTVERERERERDEAPEIELLQLSSSSTT